MLRSRWSEGNMCTMLAADSGFCRSQQEELMTEKSSLLAFLESAVTPADRSYLAALSRKTLIQCASGSPLPVVPEQDITAGLCVTNHCFVTLRAGRALRGCIGSILPDEILYRRVIESTRSAALHDPRFRPVRAGEVDGISIGLSVLTEACPLEFESTDQLLDQLVPFTHGVIIRKDRHAATYLPQVWHHVPDKPAFLTELCVKAGLAPDSWMEKDIRVEVFESLSFGEGETDSTTK